MRALTLASLLLAFPASAQPSGTRLPVQVDPVVQSIQTANDALSWARVTTCDSEDQRRLDREFKRFYDLIKAHRKAGGEDYNLSVWTIEASVCDPRAFEANITSAAQAIRDGYRAMDENLRGAR